MSTPAGVTNRRSAELALAHPHDRAGYTKAKSGIVEELLGEDGRRRFPHHE